MQTDPITLTKLISDFRDELKKCMENKEGLTGASQPILLGDFIVDMHNNYLRQAKAICDDATIQGMIEIDKELTQMIEGPDDYRRERLAKMHEVHIASGQLLTCLSGALKSGKAGPQSQLVGVIGLIENLGRRIDDIRGRAVDAEDEIMYCQVAQRFVKEYNRYLSLVHESADDAVLKELFQPLEPFEEGATVTACKGKIQEVWMAQSSLLSYLTRMYGRG
ncbi:hypothetical protein FJZ31_23635 [Candidatus Poribacteria bacterium]|nr:hypothetical protein [Candidatus Poribacteria bacterium]